MKGRIVRRRISARGRISKGRISPKGRIMKSSISKGRIMMMGCISKGHIVNRRIAKGLITLNSRIVKMRRISWKLIRLLAVRLTLRLMLSSSMSMDAGHIQGTLRCGKSLTTTLISSHDEFDTT